MNRITQNITKEPACLPGIAYEHANHNTTDGIKLVTKMLFFHKNKMMKMNHFVSFIIKDFPYK
jgi:hypothetical protein